MLNIVNKTAIDIHEYINFFTTIKNKLICDKPKGHPLRKFCLDKSSNRYFINNIYEKILNKIKNKESNYKEYETLLNTYRLALKTLKKYGYKVSLTECDREQIDELLNRKSYIIVINFIAYWSRKYMIELLKEETNSTV
jgi:hypothetical protein